ncbi:MAG: hypothetical protein ABH821_00310 [archaeon]
MTVGNLIGNCFEALKSRDLWIASLVFILVTLGSFVIFMGLGLVILYLFALGIIATADFAVIILPAIILMLVFGIIYLAITAIAVMALLNSFKAFYEKKKLGIQKSYSLAIPLWKNGLVLALFEIILIAVLFIVILSPAIITLFSSGTIETIINTSMTGSFDSAMESAIMPVIGLFIGLGLVFGIIILVLLPFLYLLFPTLAFEKKSVKQTINMACNAWKKNFLPSLAFVVIMLVIIVVLSTILSLIGVALMFIPIIGWAFNLIFSLASTFISTILSIGLITQLYLMNKKFLK